MKGIQIYNCFEGGSFNLSLVAMVTSAEVLREHSVYSIISYNSIINAEHFLCFYGNGAHIQSPSINLYVPIWVFGVNILLSDDENKIDSIKARPRNKLHTVCYFNNILKLVAMVTWSGMSYRQRDLHNFHTKTLSMNTNIIYL